MEISNKFPGGNIELICEKDNEVFIEREIRNDGGYFYWAFCVTGAQGKTVRFRFPHSTRVGRFGAAVSHDLKSWFWSNSKELVEKKDAFTYTFAPDETRVYFAHNMVYSEEMLCDFLQSNNIALETFTQTKKGRNVPCFSIGEGDTLVLITSRHHACESTGTYLLQGFAQGCLEKRPSGIKFLFVPFVDYDGVVDGDAGKGRLPHDHNRDYGETVLYPETAKLQKLADSGRVLMNFDLHSPHHDGWINDYPYIMKFAEGENEIYEKVSKKWIRLTKNDANSMTYTGEQDIEHGAKWNETTLPCNKNYFLPRTKLHACFLVETPYFALEDNRFEQHKAIALGYHLYEAAYEVICDAAKRY